MKERSVIAQARAAARKRPKPKAPLKWSEAMAEVKVPVDVPPSWHDAFRRAYAAELVKLKRATPAAKSGAPKTTPAGKHRLRMRPFRATEEEFQEHDAKAEAAGVPWSVWARRKLSEK